ncbi:MAG: hypothetical protein Q6368_008150 [Candidatus Baldrarchaeota archaeon]
MQKKFVVVILLVLIIPGVLFAMNFLKPRDYEQGYEQHEGEYISLSEEEIESILTLHIIDETDKEAAIVPESPPEPVSYPPVNITKVSFGVHEGYLFVKFEFVGKLPTEKEEPVTKITAVILLDKDCNYSTGWIGIDAVIGLDIEWDENGKLIYGFGMIYDIPDTPNMEDEQAAVQAGKYMELPYAGGPGYNYFIIQIPMNVLGLQSGKQVIMEIHAEAESPEYHHYAFDSLKNS